MKKVIPLLLLMVLILPVSSVFAVELTQSQIDDRLDLANFPAVDSKYTDYLILDTNDSTETYLLMFYSASPEFVKYSPDSSQYGLLLYNSDITYYYWDMNQSGWDYGPYTGVSSGSMGFINQFDLKVSTQDIYYGVDSYSSDGVFFSVPQEPLLVETAQQLPTLLSQQVGGILLVALMAFSILLVVPLLRRLMYSYFH